jgi:hypothetical protein
MNGQRLALPRACERVHPKDPSEARLWQELLKHVQRGLGKDEIAVSDAGLKLSELQAAGIERYVLRLATNFTARRTVLPAHTRGRKPTYGALVRPLPRTYQNNTLPTTAPDECQVWTQAGRDIRVEIWRNFVLKHAPPRPTNQTFDGYAFHDPAFKQPWLLATPLMLKAPSLQALSTDRWPVQQIPLSAMQMVGAHRQFVHIPESVQRLPELALLAGSVLSFMAATLPPSPTGFWDRHPKPTPGRLRRILFRQPFPKEATLPGNFPEKQACTAHLPKGNLPRQAFSAQC